MINLNFNLWWSGAKLSYLRYLTFKTLRFFHPNSKICLFVGDKFRKEGHKWNEEKQEFENPDDIKKDYLEELGNLDVEIKHVDWFSQYAPNFQSDMARWFFLHNYGGFYLDTDQIILKSFETLPLWSTFIYSSYHALSCGRYFPVGVLGASKDSDIVYYIYQVMPKFINANVYNSAGPWMLREVIKTRQWADEMFNAPSNYFYPVPESYRVSEIYDGSFKIPKESYALHLFLGHKTSQEFNKIYTEEMAEKSNDTISRFLRENNLI